MTKDNWTTKEFGFPKFVLDVDCNMTAKVMYCLLYDRAKETARMGEGLDEAGRVFISFTIEEMAEIIHKSQMTVKSGMNRLDELGLIQRVRQGACRPNRIYVMTETNLSHRGTD